MNEINRAVITDFSRNIDLTPFHNAYNLIIQHLGQSISTIRQRNPYISSCDIFVANETFSGTEFFASSLDLFVVFEAVQVELNYNNKPKNKFKNNLKYFWREFKHHFNIFSNKKKKNEKLLKETEKKVLSLKDYDVETLFNDLFINLTKVLYNKSTIQINGNKLTVIGEEEFGMDINIYPVFLTDDSKYKMYNISSQKHLLIDFKDRFDNIQIKNIKTGDQYTNQIRIFNNLYWNTLKQKPNQIFIESLLFSCPDELYTYDKVTTTLNLINYIKNSAMQNMHSICDESVKLFKEKLNTTNLDFAIKFINNVHFV